jgi:phosphoglucosamine mutase
MKKLFGTDGIRGVAGTFPLDSKTVGYIGLALGDDLSRFDNKGRVILGRDTRESGEWISQCLISSLAASGIRVICEAGVITTPGLAFLTRSNQFDLGVMISASHNPYEDNGIKVFSRDGFKLPDLRELDIERKVHEFIHCERPIPVPEPLKEFCGAEDLVRDYVAFLSDQFRGSLSSFQVGLDVCNGAAFSIAPQVFEGLGATVKLINQNPNGRNINQNCGSLHLEGLRELVRLSKLSFGVAFDGDADRCICVTPSGKVFDGDYALYAFSYYMKKRAELRSEKVVGTVMTNFALEKALEREGLQLVRAAVGDKYVLEEMRSVGANIGGEPSGHMILRDYHTTGDGILTAVKLAELLFVERLSLDELAIGFHPFPQVLDGLRVRQKVPIEDSPEVLRLIEDAENELRGAGRVVIRYSGTEPLLRIMAEGENYSQIKVIVSQLKSKLGAIISAMGLANG